MACNAIKNVIFDLDGTLVDSVPGIQWSVETAMRSRGISRTCRDITPLIGPPVRAILATASETADSAELDCLERAFRSAYDADGWRMTRCQDGVRALLERLRSMGISRWVVTNKPAHATGLILAELAIAEYFREVVCRDSATPPYGSKAEMLTELLRRQALSAGESILVGDTLEDCQAAAGAGISCAVVSHGYGVGLNAALPKGSRRISGWDELVAYCAGNGSVLWGTEAPRQGASLRG